MVTVTIEFRAYYVTVADKGLASNASRVVDAHPSITLTEISVLDTVTAG